MFSGKFFLKLTAVALVLFTISACSNQKGLVLSGVIESTLIDINSEVQGMITDISKDEGEPVKKGDVIAAVDSSMQALSIKQQEAVVNIKSARLEEIKRGSREQQIKQAEASVNAARAKLDELKAGNRPEQIKQAKSAVESAKAGLASAELNYNYLVKKYEDIKSLNALDAASDNDLDEIGLKRDTAQIQVQTVKEQLNSAKAQLELLVKGPTKESIKAAEANFAQAKAQLELLKSGSTEQSIEAAQYELAQSKAALDQMKLTLSKYKISSPIDGTFVSKSINIGDLVSPGTNLGSVADLSGLWVNIYVPRRYLDLISLNQELTLKSSDLTAKGKITFISSEAEFTPKNVETTEAKENMVFKVKLKIMDNIDRLKPGMLVDAYLPNRE